MRIENGQLFEFIQDSGIVKLPDLKVAFKEAQKENKKLGDVLLQKKLIPEVDLRKVYAYILGIPFVDLTKEIVHQEVLQIIPEPIAKKYKIIAFEKNGRELKIAMLNPEDIQTVDFIRKKTGLKIITCLASEDSIDNVLKYYEKSLKAEFGEIIDRSLTEITDEDAKESGIEKDLEKIAQGLPIIKVVDTLIKHAILQSASDIHIEPEEKKVQVRYRIDGILHDAMVLPKQAQQGIVARIKVLSNLKLDEHRVPQDGRFKIEKDDLKISFRVSMLPIFDGEKIVMRILNESSKGLTLEQMGLTGRGLEIIHRHIKKPNGMILVTGPTGSGKTTTLYTMMDILNTPEVNISTIEDPIEYRMPRINQTQIHPKVGLTFSSGLRALLRQDPDIIMVGEIRDNETMEMAIHSALTGHLVLSTLHTNSAAGTLPRMIDMGAEPFLLSSTINVIMAQRLVRRLCPECRKEYFLSQDELKNLEDNYDMARIFEIINKSGVVKTEKNGAKGDENWGKIKFFKAVGCEQCGNEGYHGRLGIYEVLEVDNEIERMISQKVSTEEMENKAKEKGMLTMVEDGFIKAAEGATSLEELLRVTRE
ncbi:Flp pilus assembly complex ATPase component TadA [Patescibacteria group bacterium]|nr:Flp pilus assembly complex ATPase component TadA [Patescibacteria group bacterium]